MPTPPLVLNGSEGVLVLVVSLWCGNRLSFRVEVKGLAQEEGEHGEDLPFRKPRQVKGLNRRQDRQARQASRAMMEQRAA